MLISADCISQLLDSRAKPTKRTASVVNDLQIDLFSQHTLIERLIITWDDRLQSALCIRRILNVDVEARRVVRHVASTIGKWLAAEALNACQQPRFKFFHRKCGCERILVPSANSACFFTEHCSHVISAEIVGTEAINVRCPSLGYSIKVSIKHK